DVKKLLLALTFYSIDEINEIIKTHNENPSKFYAQKKLAHAIVKDIHGEAEAKKCEEISTKLFSEEITTIDKEDLYNALLGVPSIEVENEINVIDLLVELKISTSKSNARNLITSKSVSINSQPITEFSFVAKKSDSINNKFSYLKKGKKNFFLIK
ncbi:MAG: hypothetical protein K2L48_02030, partial [Mycoplasmoidaceae bacterium]|nr:hypothetical protein [Mycoplasmoidaceae bacterium]